MSKLSEYSKFDHLVDSDDDIDDVHDDTDGDRNVNPRNNNGQGRATTTTMTTATITPRTERQQQGHWLERDPRTKRFVLSYQNRRIYEWEQTIEEVILYIPAPTRVVMVATAGAGRPSGGRINDNMIVDCQIMARHLKLGIRQVPAVYFLDHDLWDIVDINESTWCLERIPRGSLSSMVVVDPTTPNDPSIVLDDTTNSTTKDEEEWMIVIYLQKMRKGLVWEGALITEDKKLASSSSSSSHSTMNPYDIECVKKELLLERYGEEHTGFDFSNAQFNGSAPDPRTFMGGVRY